MSETPSVPSEPVAQRAGASLIAGLPDASTSLKAVMLACLNLKIGSVDFVTPTGKRIRFGGSEPGPHATLIVKNPAFARRVLSSGDIGFAEGYMAGEWDTPDLSSLLEVFSRNLDSVVRLIAGNPLMRVINLVRHAGRDNTREGSRRNIHEHYDLGNRFYETWLDPTMTYSSARFEKKGEDLTQGQLNKYRALAHSMELKPGEHVLEIGSGWGGFAEVAATEFGAHVTGLTISQEQFNYATNRIAKAGLSDKVDFKLLDYRDVHGAFDKIASIEMFEAVGEKHWPEYFAKIAEVLKPGGRAALQIITIQDSLFESYRSRADFIQRYIFPGGMLPSLERLKEETARAGLGWDKVQAFGQSYADTLAEWGERFAAHWDEIKPLGFDERFKRLWGFYLSYCEAGFRSERTDVVQVSLAKA